MEKELQTPRPLIDYLAISFCQRSTGVTPTLPQLTEARRRVEAQNWDFMRQTQYELATIEVVEEDLWTQSRTLLPVLDEHVTGCKCHYLSMSTNVNINKHTMKTIAVINHKGGVGKTTSVVNIGAYFAHNGNKVLVVDADPQANLTTSLGINPDEEGTSVPSLYELMKGRELTSNDSWCIYEHLDEDGDDDSCLRLIPSSLDLSGAEVELSSVIGREYILKDILSKVKDNYDICLIDCPPSLGLLTINALTAADSVLIPLQSQYLALNGLRKLMEVIDLVKVKLNKGLAIDGIFLTQYDTRKTLHQSVEDTIIDEFRDLYIEAPIRNNISLAEAPIEGEDIFSYAPKSHGAHDYENLCYFLATIWREQGYKVTDTQNE